MSYSYRYKNLIMHLLSKLYLIFLRFLAVFLEKDHMVPARILVLSLQEDGTKIYRSLVLLWHKATNL